MTIFLSGKFGTLMTSGITNLFSVITSIDGGYSVLCDSNADIDSVGTDFTAATVERATGSLCKDGVYEFKTDVDV